MARRRHRQTTTRKTQGRGAYGVIKAHYIKNRSRKTGKHVTADLKRVIYYNVYGSRNDNPEKKERGPIYDEHGNAIRYGDYKAWAIGKSVASHYTYRVIISPKGHLLHDDDFVSAVANASKAHGLDDEFRLVIHRDSDHAHGHLLFQSDTTFRKQQLEDWKVTLRQEMMVLEAHRAKEKGVSVPHVENEDSGRKERKRQHGQEL